MQITLDPEGPHEPESTRQTAAAVSEAVRVLNYATRHASGGLDWPADVYSVLGHLATGAARLPQSLTQMTDWMAAEIQAGHVRENPSYGRHGGDADAARAAMAGHLQEAAAAAGQLHNALIAAQQAASGLESTRNDAEEEDEEDQ
ncbi:hypothetical protein [Nocardiopsis sp. NRRL B-16309]|uniref:hypothetical protein n=1 Tax=Nocardiopsis sp. NRRL B-16309 TaxID=1519494 RepID=UPI0006AD9E68|nr:hypothetical protein [Nocardiopsis sp. NRRL B-16309]KOX11833.1 hypothetical protein ADL05_23005 [Nocardiopsis sp. NRRL B-16309]